MALNTAPVGRAAVIPAGTRSTASASWAVKVQAAEVASDMFSLSGASATGGKYGLSRPWHPPRTHASHDPVAWKYHHIGNYLLNDVPPPDHGQI